MNEIDKNELGEFFIEESCKDKKRYIDCINKFINLLPNFNPIVTFDKTTIKMCRYMKENDLRLLDIRFFSMNIGTNLRNFSNKHLEIVVDSNNVKKIIITRDIYGEVKELNNNLGLTTIKSIYSCFVLNIVKPSKFLRNIKDVDSTVKNMQLPLLCNYYLNLYDKASLMKITKIDFNIKEIMLNITYDLISFNKNNCSYEITKDMNTSYNTFTNINNIIKSIKPIDINEFMEHINEICDKKIQEIYETKNNFINVFSFN